MEIIETGIKDLVLIKPKIFADERGYFFESYNKETLQKWGLNMEFVQDNQSFSQKGVLRGIHFQKAPYEQGKLVRVIKGSVFDVAVDIRKNSETYGKWFGVELNESNKTMMYIPEGFGHGFLTLAEDTIFSYKCTNIYNKKSECTILWNDKDLNINWNCDKPILSEKDLEGVGFLAYRMLQVYDNAK